MNENERRIIILDTTLRDGDQSPGYSFSPDEKIVMAGYIEKLGVDIIEVGFPASSPGQFSAVQRVAESLETAAVSVMAMAKTEDIKKAGEAIHNARHRYIHTSIATSPIHRRMKLRKSRSEIERMAVDAVQCASEFADYVEISAEDATRTEPEFLLEFCEMVTKAGADVVNIADTVGYAQPSEYYSLIYMLYNNVNAFKKGRSRLSVHCHNDIGLAVANTLAGLSSGAMQAEVTLLGIGERGGNAPLEEIAAVLTARGDYYGRFKTALNMRGFAEAVRTLTSCTGISISPNKPVAGRNIFTHSSGIHQNGIFTSAITYSILNPEDYGYPPHKFIFSHHSGISGFNAMINELTGDNIINTEDIEFLNEFKNMADKVKCVTTTDIITMLFEEGIINSNIWYLHSCSYSVIKSKENIFNVSLEVTSIYGDRKKNTSEGSNIWDSVIAALKRLFSIKIDILHYTFTTSGVGSGSSGLFSITAEYEGIIYSDESYGVDPVEMFVKSYLNLINQISVKFNLTIS